jgi:ankyrin repeat protein
LTFFTVLDLKGRRSTALHFASGYGRKDVVEFLLGNGANISSKDDGGLMPLHNACSKKSSAFHTTQYVSVVHI